MWKKIIEWLKKLFEKETKPKPDPEPQEDLDISKIRWLGANYSSATMEKIFKSASMDKKFIYTDYDPYNWPSQGDGVVVDAICCIFYEKGSEIVGGKFDWWRKGGQGKKTLENLYHGYQGHSFPEPNAKVWTCIVAVNGSKRSNIVEVTRK